jgi:hypothetical protein
MGLLLLPVVGALIALTQICRHGPAVFLLGKPRHVVTIARASARPSTYLMVAVRGHTRGYYLGLGLAGLVLGLAHTVGL